MVTDTNEMSMTHQAARTRGNKMRFFWLVVLCLLVRDPSSASATTTWDGQHDTSHIDVTVVYFVPADRIPLPDWRDRVAYYCSRIEQFHEHHGMPGNHPEGVDPGLRRHARKDPLTHRSEKIRRAGSGPNSSPNEGSRRLLRRLPFRWPVLKSLQ